MSDKSISEILLDMEAIRKENISERRLSEVMKDDYFILAQELAPRLKVVYAGKAADKMKLVFDAVRNDDSLANYDPFRNTALGKSGDDFVTALDEILISAVGDDFVSTRGRYHILQAVKYMAGIDKDYLDFGGHDTSPGRMYPTIKPVQDNAPLKSDGFFRRLTALFLGDTYNIDKVDEFTLKVKDNITTDALTALIPNIQNQGYTAIRLNVPDDEFEDFCDLYSEYNVRLVNSDGRIMKRRSYGRGQLLEVEIGFDNYIDDNATPDALEFFKEFRKEHSMKIAKYIADDGSVKGYFDDVNYIDGAVLVQRSKSPIVSWIENPKNRLDTSRPVIEKILCPDYDAVALGNVRKIDGYSKYSVLLYNKGAAKLDDYLFTTILSDKKLQELSGASDNAVLDRIVELLADEYYDAEKAEIFSAGFAPKYLRLRKFLGDKAVTDHENR